MSKRQTKKFFLHHARARDEGLVRELWERCPPDLLIRNESPAPTWSEIGDQIIEATRRSNWGKLHHRAFNDPTRPGDGVRHLDFAIRPAYRYDLEGEGKFHSPLLEREQEGWFACSSSESYPDDADIAQWFLHKASCPIPLLSPDFGYADLARHAVGKMGDDPREKAWPVLLYGPKLIERFGRETLLSAPVWKVEERPDGLMWLQVSENPFVARKKHLLQLARHLGLEVPR